MIPAAAYAQETTATIRGTVTANAAPVADAQIVITDVNSGTKSTGATDNSGTFNITGLRGGGPYTVTVTSTSGNTTVTDIYTVIGQPFELPVDLTADAAAAPGSGDIVITASSIKGAGVTSDGPQTVLSARDISKVASVNRDIRDIERRDPFATLDLTNSRAVSFAGVNPRFNRFTIDGVQVGDNFGLNPDASPTGRGPVPFDAISQVSVSIAPYDIRQGNFQGGVIDTTLLSGSNNFHVNGFYSESTDELQGKRIGSNNFVVPNYNSKTYGLTVSGPIWRDRVFFMVSGERNTDPRPLSPASTAQVPGLTDAIVSNVSTIAQNVYKYNTGGVLSVTNNKDEKVVGKINVNISSTQKLSLSYINAFDSTDILQNSSTSSTTPSLGLASDAYTLTEVLHAGIVQLNSNWTDHLSTEVRGIYKSNRRGQDPYLGRGFAQFQVCTDAVSTGSVTGCTTGVPSVFFGPDISRQTNTLFTDTWGGSLTTRYTSGGHAFKLLTEYSENRATNLFLQRTAGAYYFDSIADFQNRSASTFGYANAVNLDINSVAANFKYAQYTFGLSDDWTINDRLKVTYGVRYDLFGQRSPVALNTAFLGRYGYTNTKTYKGLKELQPRFSFEYEPLDRLKIRGGIGIFGGGSPDIYLSNSYSNTGVLSNALSTVTRATVNPVTGQTLTCTAPYTGANASVCTDALNNVTGTTIPTSANTYLSTNLASLTTAPTASLAPDFRLPSVTKVTLSADYKIFGVTFGADFLYTKTNEAVTFTDLRSRQIGTLPDGRPRYAPITTATDTNTDIQLGNTHLGRSFIGDVRFSKQFDWGLSFGGSYTRQDVKDVSPATSSTATSLYGNTPSNDPNGSAYGVSNDQTKWAFKYNIGFDHAFFGDYRTVIQLFGETRAGRPYSYTFQNNAGTRSPVFGTVSNNDRYLLYVPTSQTDPLVSYDSTATATALDGLINSTALSKYRGQIAPKNIGRSRAFTRIDLHLEQEIPLGFFRSRLSLFGDIENLPNLINHNWGGLRQLGFPYTGAVVQVSCLSVATPTGTAPAAGVTNTAPTQTCAQYRYSTYKSPNDAVPSVANSLYLIRVGARFKF